MNLKMPMHITTKIILASAIAVAITLAVIGYVLLTKPYLTKETSPANVSSFSRTELFLRTFEVSDWETMAKLHTAV